MYSFHKVKRISPELCYDDHHDQDHRHHDYAHDHDDDHHHHHDHDDDDDHHHDIRQLPFLSTACACSTLET